MIWLAIGATALIIVWRWIDRHADGKLDNEELLLALIAKDIFGWVCKIVPVGWLILACVVGWLILDGMSVSPAGPLILFQWIWVAFTWSLHFLHGIKVWFFG